ncbi:AI-2E family transporter [Aliidiomarina halalkaliphila]|uniref:AI-2E family transporter n=1 Tax=Aliidiomarina halalkaliphila TaxID=2593535 RepID=A0A552X0U8_9GAMM|nr:AI-2E family transporter [Aliidiomarina halalkaliphila]TRW48678.1 AI-2E family transporter [Aliidiomarina halalkaliphila]
MSESTVPQQLRTPIYGLFILALLYTFYLAHAILLPIVLAILVTLLFSPAVVWLEKKLNLHRAISSLALLVALVTGMTAIGYSMLQPISEWAERVPATIGQLLPGDSALEQQLDQITESAERFEDELDEQLGNDDVASTQTVVMQTDSWRSQLATGVYEGIAGLALALALTYFLLVSGDHLVRNLARQMKRPKRQITLRILRSGQEQIARYLLVITSVNGSIGVAVGLISWAIGLPNPIVLGVMAALTRFIPYIGVFIAFGLLTVVSVATFDTYAMMLIAPLSFAVITSTVGFFLEPYIHGQRLAVNPVIIFVSIFFWGWLWGPIGVLIAVPLMTVIMVFISHIPQLKPVYNVIVNKKKSRREKART